MNHPYAPVSTDGSTHDDEDARRYRRLGGGATFTPHEDGKGYSYSYGPSGLPGLLHNSYTLGCAIFASLGGATFGYDQGVIANILEMRDFKENFPITPWQVGVMTSILELGALLGAIAAGVYADRYSRQKSIAAACGVFCIGAIFQCGARNLDDLIIGRGIGGVGVGALSMLCPLYISEISPPEVRGGLVAIEQLAIVLGVVFGFWTGFYTRNLEGSASWRIPLGLQIAPGVLLAIGSSFLPPSPRLLILQDENDEALTALAKIRRRSLGQDDPLVQLEIAEMRVEAILLRETEPESKGIVDELAGWARLFQPNYLRRTMIGVGIMFFQQWSGINALLYYGPSLMRSIGLEGDTVMLLGSGFISIVQALAVIPAIMYLDEWGRKPLLIRGAAVMTVCHGLISLLVWFCEDDWSNHRPQAWIAVGLVYLFTAAYGVSFGPIGWVLPSEVFPLSSIRSRGVAVSTASNWLNNFLIGLITPVFIHTSAGGTYLVFALACAVACWWSSRHVPETKGLSLEEIDVLFASSLGRDEADRKAQIEEDLGLPKMIQELAEE